MACREEITLFCDIQGTLIGSIDLADFCQVDTNMDGTPTTTLTIPYSLRTNWRTLLTERVMKDLVDFERLFVASKNARLSPHQQWHSRDMWSSYHVPQKNEGVNQ
jgi:hypothetical protein